jgi:hypothetical protein
MALSETTYGELFEYVAGLCNFEGEGLDINWKCAGGNSRPFLEKFFKEKETSEEC